MNQNTWEGLSVTQQAAVRSMSGRFIKAVQKSRARDGWDFSERYSVQQDGDHFVITDGVTPLPNIQHSDRLVMEALFGDAVQNYGR